MCNAPKIPKPTKPRAAPALRAPEDTAEKVQTPLALRSQRSRASLGIQQLQNELRRPSGLNVPQ